MSILVSIKETRFPNFENEYGEGVGLGSLFIQELDYCGHVDLQPTTTVPSTRQTPTGKRAIADLNEICTHDIRLPVSQLLLNRNLVAKASIDGE